MYYFYWFLFQFKWFGFSMGPSLKYVYSNIVIFRYLLLLLCFKTIEWHHKSNRCTLFFVTVPLPLRAYIFYGWRLCKISLSLTFFYLKGANLQNLTLCLSSILVLIFRWYYRFSTPLQREFLIWIDTLLIFAIQINNSHNVFCE